MSTLTYLKYSSGNGFGEERPLETGQKFGVLKDMERNVSGYKALRNEIKELRFNKLRIAIYFSVFNVYSLHKFVRTTMELQQHLREKAKFDKPDRVRFYKSQIKIR